MLHFKVITTDERFADQIKSLHGKDIFISEPMREDGLFEFEIKTNDGAIRMWAKDECRRLNRNLSKQGFSNENVCELINPMLENSIHTMTLDQLWASSPPRKRW